MTYNGGIFIVTVLGLTTGYFIFGFIRKTKYTKIYNPEGDKCCAEVDGWFIYSFYDYLNNPNIPFNTCFL